MAIVVGSNSMGSLSFRRTSSFPTTSSSFEGARISCLSWPCLSSTFSSDHTQMPISGFGKDPFLMRKKIGASRFWQGRWAKPNDFSRKNSSNSVPLSRSNTFGDRIISLMASWSSSARFSAFWQPLLWIFCVAFPSRRYPKCLIWPPILGRPLPPAHLQAFLSLLPQLFHLVDSRDLGLSQLPKFEVRLELSFSFFVFLFSVFHFCCCWRRRLRSRCCLFGIWNPGRFPSILTRIVATGISVLFYIFPLLLLYPSLLSLPLPEY